MKLQEFIDYYNKKSLECPELFINRKGDYYKARCPVHNDDRASLGIREWDEGNIFIKCFADCHYKDILRALDIPVEELVEEVEAYPYTDEAGDILYYNVRYKNPKDFRPRRFVDGEEINNLEGVRQVPYRLEKLATEKADIFVVEGEKDVHTLESFGLLATSFKGTEKEWKEGNYEKFFRSKNVFIILDNDIPGEKKAKVFLKYVKDIANVKLVYLEGIKEKQDVTDFLNLYTIEKFLSLCYGELPFSEVAERAVLTLAIKSKLNLVQFVEEGVIEYLYTRKAKDVGESLIDIFTRNLVPDKTAIIETLRELGTLKRIGIDYIDSLDIEIKNDFEYYQKILHNKFYARKYVALARDLEKEALSSQDPEQIRDKAFKNLIETYEPIHPIQSANDIALQALNRTPNSGLKFGLKDFDEMVTLNPKTLMIIAARPSMGKEQPVDVKIYTPNGYKLMGEIQIGDEVIGFDGKPKKVLEVFPQGKKKIYKVSFSDGTSTECGEEHLWYTESREDRKVHRKGQILQTKEISKKLFTGDRKFRRNYSVPYIEPVKFLEQNLPMSPYVLGALIADGSFRGKMLSFTNNDLDIVNRVSNELPKSDSLDKTSYSDIQFNIQKKIKTSTTGETKSIIKSLGLYQKLSKDKFIPDIYLYNNISNRLDLLRGLCDCDGTVSYNAWIEYSTTSKILAEQVRWLVLSLGGRATIKSRMGSYKNKSGTVVKTRTNYRVNIKFKNKKLNPFYCKRKAEKFEAIKNKDLPKFIDSIEYIGKKESQCILIDCPRHLYATDDFILTHNSLTATALALNSAMQGNLTVYFTLELSKEAVTDRILANLSFVNSRLIKHSTFNKTEGIRLAHGFSKLEKLPLYIDDTRSITTAQMTAKVSEVEAKEGRKVDLVILDYISLMHGDSMDEYVNTTRNARELQKFADRYATIALSQLSRKVEDRTNKRPTLSDLRSSGELEQVASIVAFLYRDDYYENSESGLLEMNIAKNNEDLTGAMQFAYSPQYSRLFNLARL